MTRNRGRHQTDRARARDQNILTHQVVQKRGMRRVTQRIEDRAELRRHEIIRVNPHIRLRNHHILSKRAIALHAHRLRPDAHLAASCAAVTAHAAHHVALARNAVTHLDVLDVIARLDDFAIKLVPRDHRRRDHVLRRLVISLDVQVSTADTRHVNTNQNIVRTRLRNRAFGVLETSVRARLIQSLHGSLPGRCGQSH